MITKVQSNRLVVISDLHIGNPFSNARKKVIPFLRWAAAQGYDVCINGDGLEIVQASFTKIAFEVPELFRTLGEIRKKGANIYYVTGNHDIALEHFLEDWGMLKVAPFLNVSSGDMRIRIEHGHIYDPFFIKHRVLYETLTQIGGYLLKIHPQLYKMWISFERFKSRLRAKKTGIVGEHPSFREAATELSHRGFDAIIFGHTHHPGVTELETGAHYLNPGSWMLSSYYVLVENGKVELKQWQ